MRTSVAAGTPPRIGDIVMQTVIKSSPLLSPTAVTPSWISIPYREAMPSSSPNVRCLPFSPPLPHRIAVSGMHPPPPSRVGLVSLSFVVLPHQITRRSYTSFLTSTSRTRCRSPRRSLLLKARGITTYCRCAALPSVAFTPFPPSPPTLAVTANLPFVDDCKKTNKQNNGRIAHQVR